MNIINLKEVIEKEYSIIGPGGEALPLVPATVASQAKFWELQRRAEAALNANDYVNFGKISEEMTSFWESLIISEKAVVPRCTLAQMKALFAVLQTYVLTGTVKAAEETAAPEQPAPSAAQVN